MIKPKRTVKSRSNQTKYAPDAQDTYTKRIDECQNVLDHLDKCPAWDIIQRDLASQKQLIDDNWQNLEEGDVKLRELRITKLAYNHLLNLKEGYRNDLENAKKELSKLQNTETNVVKDYDPN